MSDKIKRSPNITQPPDIKNSWHMFYQSTWNQTCFCFLIPLMEKIYQGMLSFNSKRKIIGRAVGSADDLMQIVCAICVSDLINLCEHVLTTITDIKKNSARIENHENITKHLHSCGELKESHFSKILDNYTTDVIKMLQLLFTSFVNDHSLMLKNNLIMPMQNPVIRSIQRVGDKHGHSLSVLKVAITDENSSQYCIFKPYDISSLQLVSMLIKKMNHNVLHPIRTPRLLVFKNYGWIEFIEKSKIASSNYMEKYSYQLGALLSLIYLLRGSDAHDDNFIESANGPVFIDAECIFAPQIVEFEKFEPMLLYQTMLLPRMRHLGKRHGMKDVAAVSCWLNRFLPQSCKSTISDVQNNILYGFMCGYKYLTQDPLFITKRVRSYLSIQGELTARIVLRHTAFYLDMINNITKHYLKSSTEIKKIIIANQPQGIALLKSEIECILNYIVPRYVFKVDNKNISEMCSCGVDLTASNYPTETLYKQLSSTPTLSFHRNIIKHSFYAYQHNHLPPAAKQITYDDDVLSLISTYIISKKKIYWLTFHNINSKLTPTLTDLSFKIGSLGIIYVINILLKCSKSHPTKKIVRYTNDMFIHLIEIRPDKSSASDNISEWIQVSLTAIDLLNDKQKNQLIGHICDLILSLINKIELEKRLPYNMQPLLIVLHSASKIIVKIKASYSILSDMLVLYFSKINNSCMTYHIESLAIYKLLDINKEIMICISNKKVKQLSLIHKYYLWDFGKIKTPEMIMFCNEYYYRNIDLPIDYQSILQYNKIVYRVLNRPGFDCSLQTPDFIFPSDTKPFIYLPLLYGPLGITYQKIMIQKYPQVLATLMAFMTV